MSISLDYALEHKNDPAVLCCRAEAGTVLSEHNLEDPAILTTWWIPTCLTSPAR